MRFITEFKCDDSSWDAIPAIIKHRKSSREIEMGNMIAESFGWQNPVHKDSFHHRLEIEAFPMDKWVEFKQKMFSKFIDDDYEGAGKMLEFIKELESLGKPEHEQSKTTK
jgi:hypothetical protein